MPGVPHSAPTPRWYLIPVRVLLVSFLLTLVSFALTLLLGILGLVTLGRLHSVHPDMALAYREIAMPVSIVVGTIAVASLTVLEIRNFRQARALAQIARASR